MEPVDILKKEKEQLRRLDALRSKVYTFLSRLEVQFAPSEEPVPWEFARRGQLECQGGMWVEADCNLPSGESLVRQILWGKQSFRREFGQEMDICWLPDVFG